MRSLWIKIKQNQKQIILLVNITKYLQQEI